MPIKLSRRAAVGVLVGLFLVSFFLRAYHPASWSDKKLGRARVFTSKLLRGHWAGTYQQPHPGVTMLAASGLTVRLYQSLADTPARMLFEWAIPPHVTKFGRWMALGVFGLALVLATLIVAITLALRRLGGWPVALTAAGLLAFSPYYLTQSRVVQVDALLSTFMLLSALLLLISLETGQRRYLVLSGLAGGLALLTRTSALFLVPFTGLVLMAQLVTRLWAERAAHPAARARWLARETWRGLVLPGLLWGLVAVLPFALWPAMWVEPISVLERVFGRTATHLSRPHQHPTFFMGRIYTGEDPGVLFYPVTLLFTSTFPTLTLVLVALGHYTLWRRRVRPPLRPLHFWLLVAYAFFFTIQMSIGGKKAGRYILPAHLAMELIAAVGLVGLAGVLRFRLAGSRARLARALPALLMGLGVGLQALVALLFAPDYGAHHNYLLGGNPAAMKMVEIVERNEGMLHVADYLSRQPGVESQRLVTWFPLGVSVVQYFPGEINPSPPSETDYYLFGLATMQHRVRPEDWEATWEAYHDQEPQVVVSFDGIEYLWLYATQPAEPSEHVVIRRGWMGMVGVAWAWTAALIAGLVWALRGVGRDSSARDGHR